MTTSTTMSQGQQARQGVKDDKDYKDDNKVNNGDNDDVFRCANHVLYANRAAALLKRAFRGDVYAALRDCLSALNLNPRYVKAHLRLGKSPHFLFDLIKNFVNKICFLVFGVKHKG